MNEKLSFIAILRAVLKAFYDRSTLPVFDSVPKVQALPFVRVLIDSQEVVPSKTMWIEDYRLVLEIWADGTQGSEALYKMIQEVTEVLSKEIELPEDYRIISQTTQGVQRILEQEDESKLAVVGFSIKVCYGFKMK